MFSESSTQVGSTNQTTQSHELQAVYNAIDRVQAIIQFSPDGIILDANDNFCAVVGYQREEMIGQHHSMLVEPSFANSTEYKEMWKKINRGEYLAGEIKRVHKNGESVWIQASYNPMFDKKGNLYKVIKFATDITLQKLRDADFQSQIEAINKSQSVVQFELDGTIVAANDNFCHLMGYKLSEIIGKHHRIFVSEASRKSQEYEQFWEKLSKGQFESAEFKRISKSGKEIWIQATYNPIFDGNGNPCKIVKFATDITDQKRLNLEHKGQLSAINKSQAVVEFELDGTIIDANQNFCDVFGYQLAEIRGKHHKIFIDSVQQNSKEYAHFWRTLGEGDFQTGEYRRIHKNGGNIWIQASYNPVFDENGKLCKVIKFASDVTEQKVRDADFQSQITAIERSQSVIQFELDGTIVSANDNFCQLMGYQLDEIQGKHHRIFVPREHANSVEYTNFWNRLARGEFESAEFKRISKSGSEVWIQATYNPIFDSNGNPCKVIKFATDISSQKRKNLEYEGRMMAINKSQAVIEFELDGTIISANENFCKTFGYHPAEIQGRHHSMFTDKNQSASEEYQAFWQRLGEGQFQTGEFKRVGKDGETIWIQATYNPIFDPNGKPVKVFKFATDITKEKQRQESEKALRASVECYDFAIDVSGHVIWDWDITNGTVQLNHNWLSFAERADAQLKISNKDFAGAVHEDDRQSVRERVLHSLRSDSVYMSNHRIVSPSGKVWHMEDRGAVVSRDKNGRATRFIACATDITALKQAESKLADAEERTRLLLESVTDGVISLDIHGLVSFANPAATTLLGYDSKELIGQPMHALVQHSDAGGNDYPQEDSAIYKSIIEGSIYSVDNEVFWKKNRRKFQTEYTSVPIMKNEQIIGAVVVFRDITKRKEIEFQLKQSRQVADDANKAKSDFLANMSHEIRTPMNAIIGMSHLALDTALDKKQRSYIEKVHRSAEALLGIINDILDFSKIEAGKLDIECIPFRFEDVMDNLTNVVGLKAEENGIELHYDVMPNVPMALIGDPLRLGQILTNLGNNAVKFTESGGEVVVSVEETNTFNDLIQLQFDVKDTGIGMTSEQRNKLFRSFSQADASTTRKYGGTGLGLTICQKLIKMMNGDIWVNSEQGVGSTFSFTVELQKQPDETPRYSPYISDIEGLRVLVVDDNRTAREIFSQMLTQFGFQVDQASTSDDAVAKLTEAQQNAPYELVLMDWKMPNKDGVETIKEIQSNKSIKDSPTIIMVTAYGREEASSAASGLNISGYLTKPVTPSNMLDVILMAMGKEVVSKLNEEKSDSRAEEAVNRLSGANVLLVEDNVMNQELASELLTLNNISVTIAENGQEALDMLRKDTFDGVLMDCQMPVMDGYTAAREIRQVPEWKNLPILAITANAMAGDREKVLNSGMNDHIAKPISVKEMFITMAKWIKPSNPTYVTEKTFQVEPEINIPQLPGVDIERGLATTQNNKALYLRLLHRFSESNQSFSSEFNNAVERNDDETAIRLAHTLKSTAGNIGAMSVYELAKQLETALNQDDDTAQDIFQSLLDALSDVLMGLTAIKERKVVQEPADPQKIVELVTQLEEQIEDYDTDASETIKKLESLIYKQALLQPLKQLVSAVHAYDFEGAEEKLGEFKQQLDENF